MGRLFRSDSRPVSRDERPNISRNGLLMLPSANSIDRRFSGMYVKGSGIGLEYFSVVPVIWQMASIKHLGLQPARQIACEVGVALGMVAFGDRGRLIGPRVQNQAVDALQVVVGGRQLPLQIGQQLGIDGRVVRADVVRLVNDASPQQPRPDAVDYVAGEPGILGRRQPVRERLARVLTRQTARPASRREKRPRPTRRPTTAAESLAGSNRTISSFHCSVVL